MGHSQARCTPYVTFITRKKYKLIWQLCQITIIMIVLKLICACLKCCHLCLFQ